MSFVLEKTGRLGEFVGSLEAKLSSFGLMVLTLMCVCFLTIEYGRKRNVGGEACGTGRDTCPLKETLTVTF
jgi:hypothetical protein